MSANSNNTRFLCRSFGYSIVLIGIVLLSYSQACSQIFQYPKLPPSVTSIAEFKPDKWTTLDSAYGDLNQDGLQDIALMLEYADTVLEILPPDSIAKPSVPRILVIAFQNSSGGYTLVTQNNLFLLRSKEIDLFGGGDFPGAIQIDKKDNLHINYAVQHGELEYKFRYQHNDFYLIGYTEHGTAGGEWLSDDYNFLTRKYRHKEGSVGRSRINTRVKTISTPLQSFKTFIRPGTWPVKEEDGMILENSY